MCLQSTSKKISNNIFFNWIHFSEQFRPRLGPKSNGERTKEELNKNEPAREPIDNEIPDSVNVQANLAPGANVPGAVENENESRHQLNLGIFYFINLIVEISSKLLHILIKLPFSSQSKSEYSHAMKISIYNSIYTKCDEEFKVVLFYNIINLLS